MRSASAPPNPRKLRASSEDRQSKDTPRVALASREACQWRFENDSVPLDVTIIGAGPAGATAACALARRGWRVTLIEQHRFPRDKVCGECVSALGVETLARLGLRDRLTALHPARLTHTTLHAPDGRSTSLSLPREMWGLSRHSMDLALLDAARDAGARIVQPARCESIDNGRLTIRGLEDNRIERTHPTWLLLADGKGALLPARPRPTTDFGVKAHFANVAGPRNAVELFGVSGHYVGLAPIENGRSNIAFSVPAKRIEAFRGDLEALWRQLLTENPTLADRFCSADRTGDWLASPLPRFPIQRRWPANIIPLGNAAAALEPIGGEGMGLAMRSAELAADALDHAARTNAPLPVRRLRSEFDRLWRTRRLACRALARLMSAPALAGDVVDWARGSESIGRAAMTWIGKG
jgi:flavin-dependent dehydrogenase